MVKKRKPAKRKTAKRKTAKRKAAARAAVAPPTHVELRHVRVQVQRVVQQIEAVPEPNEQIRRVLEDMRTTLASIDTHCGPIMSVPI